jgi:hypothetical protein
MEEKKVLGKKIFSGEPKVVDKDGISKRVQPHIPQSGPSIVGP